MQLEQKNNDKTYTQESANKINTLLVDTSRHAPTNSMDITSVVLWQNFRKPWKTMLDSESASWVVTGSYC